MKRFLCYDTEQAARGKINVDSRGMLKPVDSELSDTSENPVQNKVIKSALDSLSEVCDMKVSYNFNDNSYGIIHGTYDKVVNKIINDVYPTVYCIKTYATYKMIIPASVKYFNGLSMIELGCNGIIFNVYSDNRIELTD